MEEPIGTKVNERDGQVTVCASMMAGQSQDYAENVSITYHDRSANGKISSVSL